MSLTDQESDRVACIATHRIMDEMAERHLIPVRGTDAYRTLYPTFFALVYTSIEDVLAASGKAH